MSQHLIAAEIHAIACLHRPTMIEGIITLNQKTNVMMFLGERLVIGSPTFLVSNQRTVAESICRLTIETKMVSYETIILDINSTIRIIYR